MIQEKILENIFVSNENIDIVNKSSIDLDGS